VCKERNGYTCYLPDRRRGETSDEGIERGEYEDEKERERKRGKIYIPSLNSSTTTWIKSLSADSRTLFMNMGAVQRRSATRWGKTDMVIMDCRVSLFLCIVEQQAGVLCDLTPEKTYGR